MTDFAVTGKKRSGKGLFCAGLIRDALLQGRRVATNMDIFPENVLSATSQATYIRLPDCPTVRDLDALGQGNDIVDDEKNGIIVLDEASKYFNSRDYADKNRKPLLDWLIHSGKLGWDVYYQMQGLIQVDKQLRETQVEYHIAVKNTSKWPIPFLSPFLRLFGINLRFPKMHVGIMRHGCAPDALLVERKWYRAKDLYNAYDTRQVFLDNDHPKACGIHTVLSPWYIKGRYLNWIPSKPLRFVFGVIGYDWTKARVNQAPKIMRILKPKLPIVQKLGRLKPDDAVKHWHRLDSSGAF